MGFYASMVLASLMLLGRSLHTVCSLRASCTSASLLNMQKHTRKLYCGSIINTDISLKSEEKELFDMFTTMVEEEEQMGTTVRIAGVGFEISFLV